MLALERLSGATCLMRLDCPEIARTAFAGQFVNLRVHDFVVPLLRRPFSLCRRQRDDGWIEVLWKVVGEGTRILTQRRVGESVDVLGPLGQPFRLAPPSARALLVAGGIGVAPLLFLCEELITAGVDVEVFLGARTAVELSGVNLFEEMGVEVDLSTDDGSLGRRGFVTVAVEERLQELGEVGNVWLYGCGPEPMLARVDDIALCWQVNGQVSVETVMGCGFGICMGCALPARDGNPGGGIYKLACVDGPVFRAGEVVLHG